MTAIIETKGLAKRYKDFTAVEDLSFSIMPGDVYGFLGENGAGKSTTMRMLLGLIQPTAGQVFIKGTELSGTRRQLLQHIGAIIERPDMYGYLSGWDNLRMFATLSKPGIPDKRLHEVLELTGLKGRERDKVKAYSQGMKQRLGIAIALIHDPELLILDEPTNGLDPQGIAEMRRLILELSSNHGKTILISSHLLHEIEQVATRMLIMHKGRKMVEGRVHELLNPEATLIDITWQQDDRIMQAFMQSDWKQYLHDTAAGRITVKMHPQQMPQLNLWLAGQGALITEIRAKHSLEAFFLSLTNDTDTTLRTV